MKRAMKPKRIARPRAMYFAGSRTELPPDADEVPVRYFEGQLRGERVFVWIHDCPHCLQAWDEKRLGHGPFKTMRQAERNAMAFALRLADGWHGEPLQ